MATQAEMIAEAPDGADDGRAWVDRQLWEQLATSLDPEDFYSAWLLLLCRQLSGVRSALVLAETEAEKTFAPAAGWPAADDVDERLVNAARSVLDDREAVVLELVEFAQPGEAPGDDSLALAFPLLMQGSAVCVAALAVAPMDEDALETAMRRLQWSVSWLEAFYLRFQGAADEATIDRLVTAVYLAANTARSDGFHAAVTALVTELATRLDCERVSCGFIRRRHVKVESVSHTGQFGRQMNLVNAIGKVMDEVVGQGASINYPASAESGLVTLHHEALARQQNGGAILTVPMVVDGKPTGAICLERSTAEPFDEETVQLCESIASVVGPILRDKRRNDRWIGAKIRDSLATQLGRLLGRGYLGRKLFLLFLAAVAAALFFARGEFRVTADTVLEGSRQRAVVAPYDGYVASSIQRVGDRVGEGDLIATLDDTDLRLDLVEITSGKAQAQSQYDEALASYDRAGAKLFKAKLDQADARIGLVQEKLRRTQLVSPLEGMIVSGDLSQSLGAAVARGDVLFEIASLYSYRVNLQVDERDISHVHPGQSVNVVLSALPDDPFTVTVESITPVTRAAEGRNFFRVEASLEDPEGLLRPGMEGVAKISIDERRYAWIWTRELIHWLRLWSWRWLQ